MTARITIAMFTLSTLWACGGDSVTTPEQPIFERGLHEVGKMTRPRSAHVATLLQNGKVLIAGGYRELLPNIADVSNRHISAEIFDPETGISSPTGNLTVGRYNDKGILLPDGRVLIMSRLGRFPIEYYDPGAGSFNAVATVPANPAIATATLLPSGKVFATNPQHTGVFDPGTGTFPSIAATDDRSFGHTSTLLKDGRVLIVGGTRGRPEDGLVGRNLIFDPSSNAFTKAGELQFDRSAHKAVLLQDGRVLIAGGLKADQQTHVQTAEIYDPATNTFSPAGTSLIQPIAATLLPSGKVFLIHRLNGDIVLYDPATHTFDPTGHSMGSLRQWATITPLEDGRVMVAGGIRVTQDDNWEMTDQIFIFAP